MFNGKKLYKSKENKLLFGVCSGIGNFFAIDPTLVRLGATLIALFSVGAGLLAYLIAAIIIPDPPMSDL